MVVALFGDSCTGKSTLASNLAQQLSAEVYSGKDYLRLAKSESMAAALFKKKLGGVEPIIYVISEKEQLALLPTHCVRVLVTASLKTIKERFAQRMGENCPLLSRPCWSGNSASLKRSPVTCALTRIR